MGRNAIGEVSFGRTAAAAVAGLLIAGCATVPVAGAYGSGHEVLQARLYEPIGGQLGFAVSRAAYVVIFEVTPDGRLAMLYPMSSTQVQRRFTTGHHTFSSATSHFNRRFYTYASDYRSPLRPTYLVLIAADRPLRLHRVSSRFASLAHEFAFSRGLAAHSSAVERLAASIVPDPDFTEWTYDTYEVWPPIPVVPVPTYRVVCADGTIRIIHGGRIPADCRRDPRRPTPPPDSAGPTPPDSGSAKPKELPRRPPRATPGAGVRKEPGRIADSEQRSSARAGERRLREGRSADDGSRARVEGVRNGARPQPAEQRRRTAANSGQSVTKPGTRSDAAGSRGRSEAGAARGENSGNERGRGVRGADRVTK